MRKWRLFYCEFIYRWVIFIKSYRNRFKVFYAK